MFQSWKPLVKIKFRGKEERSHKQSITKTKKLLSLIQSKPLHLYHLFPFSLSPEQRQPTIEMSMTYGEYHCCVNNDVNNDGDKNTGDQKPPQQCQWIVHKQRKGWPPSKVLSWKWILITLTQREHKDKDPAFKAKTQPNTVMFNSVWCIFLNWFLLQTF